MNLPLFLVPRASRTVSLQRRHAGELVGPILEVPSRLLDVAQTVNAAEPPIHELRITGTRRALIRIGAVVGKDITGTIWSLWVPLPSGDGGAWITCYERGAS